MDASGDTGGAFSSKTLTNGSYTLPGFLGSTANTLQITIPSGYNLTNGGTNPNTNPRSVIVVASDVNGVNFGISLTPTYTISGNIVNDVNKNGQFDAGDTNFNNHYNIKITKTDLSSSVSFQTNGSGSYTSPPLAVGEYLVEYNDSAPAGFSTSFPSTLSQVRYLGPLQVVRDLKRIGALPQDTPDTIASAIDLVSPASFLRQQTR